MPSTIIGQDVVFKGRIKAGDTFHVRGLIDGEIQATGPITIEKDGCVKGEIEAQELRVMGKMEGELRVSRQLEVEEAGQLCCLIDEPPERLILSEKACITSPEKGKKKKS